MTQRYFLQRRRFNGAKVFLRSAVSEAPLASLAHEVSFIRHDAILKLLTNGIYFNTTFDGQFVSGIATSSNAPSAYDARRRISRCHHQCAASLAHVSYV
jgi:hypothetical protein